MRSNFISFLVSFSALGVTHGVTHSTTKFHEDGMSELAEPRHLERGEASVPPAVIRSLRNIRREVVVDIEGRNVVR